jgi:CcmD family protein
MYKTFYFVLFLFLSSCISLSALAQDSVAGRPVEMADHFRADGKIYVVIAVVVTILLGLIAYVMRLDSKISRFEKEFK